MSIHVVFKNCDRSSTLVEFIEKKSKELFERVNPSSTIYYYIEKLTNGLKISLRLTENGKYREAKVVRSNAYDGVGSAVKKIRKQIDRNH